MKNIAKKVRDFVKEECEKSTSNYGEYTFNEHFVPMVKIAKKLAIKRGADEEIVEIASWLHDIGSIIEGRENHHITGAIIAGKKLRELGYPEDKISKIKDCILSHRGSRNIKPKTKEARIIAEADGLDIFDRIEGLFRGALVYEKLTAKEAGRSFRDHTINSYNKLSDDAKQIIKDKYEAAMLLLE